MSHRDHRGQGEEQNPEAKSEERESKTGNRAGLRPAFTLAELMVSVAILVVAMLAVGYIFSSVTKTSGMTTATIELTDAADVLQKTMQRDLDIIVPGALIIRSPDPNVNLADLPTEPAILQSRIDAMMFFGSGSPGWFQSFWNPYVTSSEALIWYGHGMEEIPGNMRLPLNLFDRILCRRAVLLVPERLTATLSGPDPNWGYGRGGLDPDYIPPDSIGQDPWNAPTAFNLINLRLIRSMVDVIQTRTAADFITRMRSDFGIPWAFVWPSYAPAHLPDSTTDPLWYYNRGRHCFNLMPHVGEMIIEWTDGSVANPLAPVTHPDRTRLQWFGLGRDVDGNGWVQAAVDFAGSTDVLPKYWWLRRYYGDTVPRPEIEVGYLLNYPFPQVPPFGSLQPLTPAGYWAYWLEKTWQYRPKAIRVIVRLYDSNKRMRDDSERLGRDYSFVLQVP